MDLHKNYLQIAVIDGKGKVLENSRIDNKLGQAGKFFDNLNDENTRIISYGIIVCGAAYTTTSQKKSASM